MAGRNDKAANPRRARLSAEEMSRARKVIDAWLRRAVADERLTPAAFRVAYALIRYVDWGTFDGAYMEQATLAAEIHVTDRTVRDALKSLERCGYISSKRRYKSSNIYALTIDKRPDFSGQPPEIISVETRVDMQEISGQSAIPENISGQKVERLDFSGQDGELNGRIFPPRPEKNSSPDRKKTADNQDILPRLFTESAVASARPQARASAPSQGTGVDRFGVQAAEDRVTVQKDSSPSHAGSLSRLAALSPAEICPDGEERLPPEELERQLAKERREEERDEQIARERKERERKTYEGLDGDIQF